MVCTNVFSIHFVSVLDVEGEPGGTASSVFRVAPGVWRRERLKDLRAVNRNRSE